jgi:hypothetical protein
MNDCRSFRYTSGPVPDAPQSVPMETATKEDYYCWSLRAERIALQLGLELSCRLLRTLGRNSSVFCVAHKAQVNRDQVPVRDDNSSLIRS